jgi:hypothetical protein
METVLRDELAGLAHQQCERVEIAGVELDRHSRPAQLPVRQVEREIVEAKAAGRHFSAKPQKLLMPLTSLASKGAASIRHGDKAMARAVGKIGKSGGIWRIAGWGWPA